MVLLQRVSTLDDVALQQNRIRILLMYRYLGSLSSDCDPNAPTETFVIKNRQLRNMQVSFG